MSDIIGASQVIADFEGAARRCGPIVDLLTGGAAQRVETRAAATVKVRTGRTRGSVGTTRNGPADYSVGGSFEGSGRRLELGGSRGGAQPWLFPSAEAEVPGLTAGLGRFVDDI